MSTQPYPGLFGRRYELSIQTTSGDTITVSSDSFEPEALKFTYEIETSAMSDMWTATFEIYNLDLQTITTLINQGSSITLQAGYQNGQQYGIIWTGKVLWAEFSRKNVTDQILTIQSIAGGDLINKMVSLATGPFQTQRQLLLQMCQAANLTVNDPGNMINNTDQLPSPKVFFGQSRKYIGDAVRTANTWGFPSFTPGEVNILALKLTSSVPEIIYSSPIPVTSRLQADPTISYTIIGTPKQTLIADTQWGIAFKVLCDSRLKVQAIPQLIKIDQSVLIDQTPFSFGAPPPVLSKTGNYCVVAVGNYGDTRGNEYYTEVLAIGTSGTMIGFPSSDGKDNRYISTQQGGKS
jgi:hypothetical protein